jgi:hypothetical protein
MNYEDDDFEKMNRKELVAVAKLLRDKLLMTYCVFISKAGQFDSFILPIPNSREIKIPAIPDLDTTFSDFIKNGALEQYLMEYTKIKNSELLKKNKS